MKQYSYWKPGSEIGRVKADSPYHAASMVLNTLNPWHCHGYSGHGGYGAVYINDYGQTCKLWEMYDNA